MQIGVRSFMSAESEANGRPSTPVAPKRSPRQSAMPLAFVGDLFHTRAERPNVWRLKPGLLGLRVLIADSSPVSDSCSISVPSFSTQQVVCSYPLLNRVRGAQIG